MEQLELGLIEEYKLLYIILVGCQGVLASGDVLEFDSSESAYIGRTGWVYPIAEIIIESPIPIGRAIIVAVIIGHGLIVHLALK